VLGWVALVSPELAIAVSNAGALGAIGTESGATAADVQQRVSRMKSGTDRPFALNYLLAFDPVSIPAALHAGAPIIQFAWNSDDGYRRGDPQGGRKVPVGTPSNRTRRSFRLCRSARQFRTIRVFRLEPETLRG